MARRQTHRLPIGLTMGLMALLVGVGGCTDSSNHSSPVVNAMLTTAARPTLPAGVLQWSIDSVESIGGLKPVVLGAPKVVDEASFKAVRFDGVKDGLILPVVPLAGMQAFTLEVLFRPESDGAAEQRFMHGEDEAGNRFTVETRLTPEGQWSLDTFLLAGPSRRSLWDQTKLHPTDQWYWVALRYDGTTMVDFVNGVKELEGPVTFPPMGAVGRISVGVRLNQVGWFKGEIRAVRVTPRALVESELQRMP